MMDRWYWLHRKRQYCRCRQNAIPLSSQLHVRVQAFQVMSVEYASCGHKERRLSGARAYPLPVERQLHRRGGSTDHYYRSAKASNLSPFLYAYEILVERGELLAGYRGYVRYPRLAGRKLHPDF